MSDDYKFTFNFINFQLYKLSTLQTIQKPKTPIPVIPLSSVKFLIYKGHYLVKSLLNIEIGIVNYDSVFSLNKG